VAEDLSRLVDKLPAGAVVTDQDIAARYRRDRADLVISGTPLAVVRATCVADVSATLAWANERAVPVVPRGAGTGLAGGSNAIDGCITLSLERMTAIREINARGQYAIAEAGVVNADLGRAAAAASLFYPPDPGSFEICTIGGNLATNAGGMRCVKYGVTRDSVLALEVVLADGAVLHTGSDARKDVAGYDLSSLFVGSEGTLGVITSATLRLRPAPPFAPLTFVASFSSLAAIGDAVDRIRESGIVPSMLELIDKAAINAIENYRAMGLDRAWAGILIGQADGAAADHDLSLMAKCCEQAGADLIVRAADRAESDLLLETRRIAGTAIMAAGPTVIEDVGVPPGQLTRMLEAVQRVRLESGMAVAVTAHAGDGNIHPALMLPDLSPAAVSTALSVAEELCRSALELGGTVTGEHGVGVLKLPWLRQQLDATSLGVHRAIKAALDPVNILNPGRCF
jgi:glycolate oxidase